MNERSFIVKPIYIHTPSFPSRGCGAQPTGSAKWLGPRLLGFGVAAKTVFSLKRYKPREGEVDRFAQSPNLTTVPVWTHSLKFAPARRRRQRARCGPDWRCTGY